MAQGVGPISWFEIEDVFIGDGRDFDEFRINIFPSHAAFDAIVADPARVAGQVHRVAAIADTYTTANAIIINALGGEGGAAGSCEGSYLCCHDCADFAADLLPFNGSACFPASETELLTGTPACTCD